MDIEKLQTSKLISCAVVFHVLRTYVRKDVGADLLDLVVRDDELDQIDAFVPRDIGRVARVGLVHGQDLLRDALEAHGGYLQTSVRPSRMYALAEEPLVLAWNDDFISQAFKAKIRPVLAGFRSDRGLCLCRLPGWKASGLGPGDGLTKRA